MADVRPCAAPLTSADRHSQHPCSTTAGRALRLPCNERQARLVRQRRRRYRCVWAAGRCRQVVWR